MGRQGSRSTLDKWSPSPGVNKQIFSRQAETILRCGQAGPCRINSPIHKSQHKVQTFHQFQDGSTFDCLWHRAAEVTRSRMNPIPTRERSNKTPMISDIQSNSPVKSTFPQATSRKDALSFPLLCMIQDLPWLGR